MAEKNDNEGTIIIGAGVEFKGEMAVPGRAIINGTFDGHLHASELLVGPSGQVNGQIQVQTAEIHGRVGENLVVQSKLIIRSSGAVSGTVSYSRIVVEEGGELVGTFSMNSSNAAEAAGTDAKVVHLQQAE